MALIHYHGTPISPVSALYEIAGRHFCVSHRAPQDVQRVHMIGQSVMLDNGAFSKWKSGNPDCHSSRGYYCHDAQRRRVMLTALKGALED